MQHHRTRKRLSKEDLKEDEFLTWVYGAIGYAERNYPKIIAGIAVVAAAVLVVFFWRSSAERQERAAHEAIGQVQVHLMQGNLQEAVNRAEQITAQYEGQQAAARALLLLGNAYFDMGRIEDARSAYRSYLEKHGSEGPQGYGAWAGLAACLEQSQNLSEAARKYVEYADAHPDSPFAPIALKEAARSYEIAGNREARTEVLRRIVEDYPESQVRRDAESTLRMLGQPVG